MANITGTKKNDKLLGTSAADTISGLAGNDLLDGKAGADTLIGGLGNDTYIIDNIKDKATELAKQGTDLIQASVSFSLGLNVENITLTGSKAINATGNGLDNIIIGNNAANKLTGGLGIDTMTGGKGDDTYVIDASDILTELADGGTDTVLVATTYTLLDNFENLTLTGSGNVFATGNAANNILTGNDGNNALDGGLGADTMSGGKGDDTYFVDADDTLTENADEGVDTVVSNASYTLGVNIENLTLGGDASINGTGNALDNTIFGTIGDNVLSGLAGSDYMEAGEGDDTYFVDAGDTVKEFAGEGTDIVVSDASYTLLVNFENLTLGGVANVNGTGNSADNNILGNDGNNRLDGNGGNDSLTGGKGDDTYVAYGTGESFVELADGGTDTVELNYSAFSFTLADNFENVTLAAGQIVNEITGNAASNVITGNEQDNIFYTGNTTGVGTGSTIVDTIYGGDGSDVLMASDGLLTFDGGAQVDWASFINFTGGIKATLVGTASGFVETIGLALNKTTLQSVEFIVGTDAADSFIFQAGGPGVNSTVYGNMGADTFNFAFDDINGMLLASANIADFTDGVDHLVFDTSSTAFDTAAEVFAVLSAGASDLVGKSTLIASGSYAIVLLNLNIADFDVSDILVI